MSPPAKRVSISQVDSLPRFTAHPVSPGGDAAMCSPRWFCEVVADHDVPVRTCNGGDRQRVPAGFAPLAIGLYLTAIHLISIRLPARQ